MFRRIGDLLDARAEADSIVASFASVAAEIARRLDGHPRRRTVLLEWFDPPYNSGHWNPELIALAGGTELLGPTGIPSVRVTWADLAHADPEVVILSPCGFTLERSSMELPALLARPEWQGLTAAHRGDVVLADGSAYFSRPGPRLEASLQIAAAAIAPDLCGDLARGGVAKDSISLGRLIRLLAERRAELKINVDRPFKFAMRILEGCRLKRDHVANADDVVEIGLEVVVKLHDSPITSTIHQACPRRIDLGLDRPRPCYSH